MKTTARQTALVGLPITLAGAIPVLLYCKQELLRAGLWGNSWQGVAVLSFVAGVVLSDRLKKVLTTWLSPGSARTTSEPPTP